MADTITNKNSSESSEKAKYVSTTGKSTFMTSKHPAQGPGTVVAAGNNREIEEVPSDTEYPECPVCPAMSLKETKDPARKRSHYQVHKSIKK